MINRSSGAEVITIADDKKVFFGTNKDVSREYDEDDTDSLLISGGGDVTIADDKKLNFGTGKDVSIEYDEDGNDTMLITGAVTFADGSTDVDIASHDGTNGLKLGGDIVTRTATQINAAREGTVTSVVARHWTIWWHHNKHWNHKFKRRFRRHSALFWEEWIKTHLLQQDKRIQDRQVEQITTV